MHIQLGTVDEAAATAALKIVPAHELRSVSSLHVGVQALLASKSLAAHLALESESFVVLTKYVDRQRLLVSGGEAALITIV